MEANSLTWLKLWSPTFNLKLKKMAYYLTTLPLCKEFARGIHSQYCYGLLQMRYLPISLIRIRGIRIGVHEIKIVNFSDSTTIFLREIACLNRVQVILIQYEDASSSKINFSKAKPYWLEYIKIEWINQDKWNRHKFQLKCLESILVTLSSIIPIGIR